MPSLLATSSSRLLQPCTDNICNAWYWLCQRPSICAYALCMCVCVYLYGTYNRGLESKLEFNCIVVLCGPTSSRLKDLLVKVNGNEVTWADAGQLHIIHTMAHSLIQPAST